MKGKVLVIAVVLGGALLWWAMRPMERPVEPDAAPVTVPVQPPSAAQREPGVPHAVPESPRAVPPSPGAPAAPAQPTAAVPVAPPPRPTRPMDPEAQAAQSDGENIRLMFRDFRTLMGENPVGSNAEIMKAVMGGNKKQARLGPPTGQNLNGEGELVDRWGTPYFFHQMSATEMEIRSAGPDQKMWTGDDVVAR